jgi:hypothetical protein
MIERRDAATWSALEKRLTDVERYIPAAPPWRPGSDASSLTGRVRLGPAFGRSDERSQAGRRRLVLVLTLVLLLLALLAALILSTGRPTEDLADASFGPYGLYRGSDASANAAVLPDGRALIVSGGWQGFEGIAVARADLWDPVKGVESASPPITPRVNPTATLLGDGRVLVVGGFGGPFQYPSTALASAETWDPKTGVFRRAGSMADARVNHTATLLADGRVLVIGGLGPRGSLQSAELWDPKSETFSPAGIMAAGQSGHAAALLPDGQVIVDGGGSLAQAWRPALENFSSGPGSLDAPEYLTMTRLLDGRVLVVQGTPATASIDIMFAFLVGEEAGSSFRDNLNVVRTRHAATLLSDGRVLVSGGVAKSGELLDSVELFDPALNRFVDGPPLERPVAGHMTFLLPDGRVLVVLDGSGPDGFVDPFIYDPKVEP